MNIDNMKRLKSHLELESQKFKYACYIGEVEPQPDDFDDDEDEDGFRMIPHRRESLRDLYEGKCGTVGCLAGMAASIALVEDGFVVGGDSGYVSIESTAAKWLGLEPNAAWDLFMGVTMAERLDGFDNSNHALTNATPLDAAKLLQLIIDEETVDG